MFFRCWLGSICINATIVPGINKPRPNGRKRFIHIFQIVISLWLITYMWCCCWWAPPVDGSVGFWQCLASGWCLRGTETCCGQHTHRHSRSLWWQAGGDRRQSQCLRESRQHTLKKNKRFFNCISVTSLQVSFQDLIFQQILISHEDRWGAGGSGESVTLW